MDRIFVQLLETLIYAAIALGGRQKLPSVEYATVQQQLPTHHDGDYDLVEDDEIG